MNSGNRKSRPMIVTFVLYDDRRNVFVNKKVIKGKNISITERLTKERMGKLKEARERYGFKRMWTIDGTILFKVDDS